MGNINISDLRPAGVDLFLDTESYLNDLTEGEMMNTGGNLIIISNGICIFTGSFTCPPRPRPQPKPRPLPGPGRPPRWPRERDRQIP